VSEVRGEEAAVGFVGKVQAVPHAFATDHECPVVQPTDLRRRGEVAPDHVAHTFPQAEPIQDVHHQVTTRLKQPRGLLGKACQVR
jgi:hypothetical protein